MESPEAVTRTDLIAADHHGGGVTRPDALSHVVYRGCSATVARSTSMSPRCAAPLDAARPVTAREESGEP